MDVQRCDQPGIHNYYLVLTNLLTRHIQDDCLAINKGQNIVFENNYCHGGHGVSIVRDLI